MQQINQSMNNLIPQHSVILRSARTYHNRLGRSHFQVLMARPGMDLRLDALGGVPLFTHLSVVFLLFPSQVS